MFWVPFSMYYTAILTQADHMIEHCWQPQLTLNLDACDSQASRTRGIKAEYPEELFYVVIHLPQVLEGKWNTFGKMLVLVLAVSRWIYFVGSFPLFQTDYTLALHGLWSKETLHVMPRSCEFFRKLHTHTHLSFWHVVPSLSTHTVYIVCMS